MRSVRKISCQRFVVVLSCVYVLYVCMYFKNKIFEINEWFLCLLWDFTLKQYFTIYLDSFFGCLCWKYFLTCFFVYILNCNSFSFLNRPPRSWVFNTLFIQYYSVICRPSEPRTCDLEVCSLTTWPSHLLHQTVILPLFFLACLPILVAFHFLLVVIVCLFVLFFAYISPCLFCLPIFPSLFAYLFFWLFIFIHIYSPWRRDGRLWCIFPGPQPQSGRRSRSDRCGPAAAATWSAPWSTGSGTPWAQRWQLQ